MASSGQIKLIDVEKGHLDEFRGMPMFMAPEVENASATRAQSRYAIFLTGLLVNIRSVAKIFTLLYQIWDSSEDSEGTCDEIKEGKLF